MDAAPSPESDLSQTLLSWILKLLIAAIWCSTLLFGFYIAGYYLGAPFQDDMSRWNRILPKLHKPGGTSANASMGLHFAGGALILMLGNVQFIESLRQRLPGVHRFLGRVYALACLATAIGGLAFIAMRGTVGGLGMNIGFALYGLLMFLAVIQTIRHAMNKRFELHRAWALRLYVLALGSWLYRVEYGIWIFSFGEEFGHTENFRGWFDQIMNFFFFVPNLLCVELFLSQEREPQSTAKRWLVVGLVASALMFVLVGTYFFTTELWWPYLKEIYFQ